jgi:hypothetical protein
MMQHACLPRTMGPWRNAAKGTGLTPVPSPPKNRLPYPTVIGTDFPTRREKTTGSAAQSQFLANPVILQLTIPITTAADGGSVQRRLSAAETLER